MITSFKHKGYFGVIDTIDPEQGLLSGTVLGMRDVIHFEGRSVAEANNSFKRAVDAYIALCKKEGVKPEKPKSGTSSVRVPPDLHRRIEMAAVAKNLSLNEWVTRQLDEDARRQVEELIGA